MRTRIPHPLLVAVAACVVSGLPASGGPAHAQTPDSSLKVPQNYAECDSLFDDLMAQWSETMVGGDYQKFLQQTNFDHIIPDLCKQGQYQQVYNIAKGFLEAPSAPATKQQCTMLETVGVWTAYADETGYRMITQAQIAPAPDKPATAGPPAGPAAPGPQPTVPVAALKLSAQFAINVKGALGSGSVTRSYAVTYDFGWNPAPATVNVTLTPDSGGTRQAAANVSGNDVDVTAAFNQPGSSSAVPEYGFGKQAQLKIDSKGATLLTMNILFDGLSKAEGDVMQAHARYADLSGLSRCAPHAASAPGRKVGKP